MRTIREFVQCHRILAHVDDGYGDQLQLKYSNRNGKHTVVMGVVVVFFVTRTHIVTPCR
jgi:hypothetical protein